MLKSILSFTLLLGLCQMMTATPDHHIRQTERLIGSNDSEYAVIRTEWDNHGSYYISQEKQYFEIFEKKSEDPDPLKSAENGKMMSSTLIVNQKHIEDLSLHPSDPNYDKLNVIELNKDLTFAEVLRTYPYKMRKFSKLTQDELARQREANGDTYGFIWEGWVKEKFGADKNSKLQWRCTSIAQDDNCFYLTVEIGGEEDHVQRIICIPPKRVKQFKDRMYLEDVNIMTTIFETEKEAQLVAQKIQKVNVETDGYRNELNPAIWAKRVNDKTVYVVLGSNSANLLRNGSFEKLKGLYAIDFNVQDTKGLVYKVNRKKSK